jgi:hypothetical protein
MLGMQACGNGKIARNTARTGRCGIVLNLFRKSLKFPSARTIRMCGLPPKIDRGVDPASVELLFGNRLCININALHLAPLGVTAPRSAGETPQAIKK